MSTYSALYYHIAFSTKNRVPQIHNDWRIELHKYMAGTIKSLGGFVIEVGGVEDHVHILTGLKPRHCVSDFMREVKTSSSKWVHQSKCFPGFGWQDGYAAFTVSPTGIEGVQSYVRKQVEHHREVAYLDELIEMLEKAGIEYDPKYLE